MPPDSSLQRCQATPVASLQPRVHPPVCIDTSTCPGRGRPRSTSPSSVRGGIWLKTSSFYGETWTPAYSGQSQVFLATAFLKPLVWMACSHSSPPRCCMLLVQTGAFTFPFLSPTSHSKQTTGAWTAELEETVSLWPWVEMNLAAHLPFKTGNNCVLPWMPYAWGQRCSAWLDFTVLCSQTATLPPLGNKTLSQYVQYQHSSSASIL